MTKSKKMWRVVINEYLKEAEIFVGSDVNQYTDEQLLSGDYSNDVAFLFVIFKINDPNNYNNTRFMVNACNNFENIITD